jgi:membrane-bound metal-dependent hydrolase YbcI (DUF457 family)
MKKNMMRIIDIIFWGWYRILQKTIYAYKVSDGTIGPEEHSFFITFLFHGVNVWTILRFLAAKYFNQTIPLFLSLTLAMTIFYMGYFIYFKRRRVKKIISYNTNAVKGILLVILSVAYVIASIYSMFQVSNYVRGEEPI